MSEVIIKDVFGVDISFTGETPTTRAHIDCSMSTGSLPILGKHTFVRAAYIAIINHDDLVAKNKALRDKLLSVATVIDQLSKSGHLTHHPSIELDALTDGMRYIADKNTNPTK